MVGSLHWLKKVTTEESYNIHIHKSQSEDTLCVCTQCGGANPAFERWGFCPRKCGDLLCSIRCLQAHCDKDCCFKDLGFMKFGEGFSGPNAPLTWAHSCEGISVLTPFDKLFDCKADLLSPSGCELLKEFDYEEVLLEHWGPDCKLMSRARGRPIKLASGRWVEGPRAMRSDDYPLGPPWLPGHAQARIRRSNDMFTFSLNRLKRRLKSLGVAVIEHPFRSFGRQFPLAAFELFFSFLIVFWSCCFGGSRKKGTAFLHNCPHLHKALHQPECLGHNFLKTYEVHALSDGSLRFDTEIEAEYPWGLCQAYAKATEAYSSDMNLEVIPPAPSSRGSWILGELLSSTKRLNKAGVLQEVLPELDALVRNLTRGNEMEHLKALLRKQSGFQRVRCEASYSDLGRGSRQPILYPAPIWDWKCVHSYQWQESQHINVLELIAFLIYFRKACCETSFRHTRAFHIFDSRVCSCYCKGAF